MQQKYKWKQKYKISSVKNILQFEKMQKKNRKMQKMEETNTKSLNEQCRTVPEKENCVCERMRQLSENKIKSR